MGKHDEDDYEEFDLEDLIRMFNHLDSPLTSAARVHLAELINRMVLDITIDD